jgi:hypothetical protein
MLTQFTVCELGRYFIGPIDLLLIVPALVGQIALVVAIQTSPIHNKNVCYQTILIVGLLNLLQLLMQFQVSLDILACGSVSRFLDSVSIIFLFNDCLLVVLGACLSDVYLYNRGL